MLEEVVTLLATGRKRVPLEAPWEYTEAYARLVIANGFARLGLRARAIELGEAARSVLGGIDDVVHSFLADVYFHRLECALALQPRTQHLPARLVDSWNALGRVDRYKVDRLLESSPTLSITGRAGFGDAIGSWITNRRVELSRADVTRLDDLRTIEEPKARAALIATLFEQPESDEVVTACFDALTELPYDLAVPLLPDVAAIAPRRSPIVRAKACFVAARFGFGELAAPIVSSLAPTSVDPAALPLVVPPLLRTMRWLGLDDDIAATVDDVVHRAPPATESFRFIIAAVDPGRGDRLIDTTLETHATLRIRLDRSQAIAAGASYAHRERGSMLIRRLFDDYQGMSDGYGTNSHYCLTVLRYIESLVLAICDLELANLNVLDATSQQLLTSGFAA